MFVFAVDDDKVSQIPASLSAWCATKGPRTLVAELEQGAFPSCRNDAAATSDVVPSCSLRSYCEKMGPRARLAALGYC